MKVKLNILFLLLASGCEDQNIKYDQIKDSVKAYQVELVNNGITGSNITRLYHNNKIQFTNVVNSNKKEDKNINDDSIFPIWSMSKPITIVAMMILFERGKYNLEDNVSDYIPIFADLKCKSNNEIYRCKKDLKIIHLLTHTSGFRYYDEGIGNLPYAETSYVTLEDWINELVKNQHVEFEPGTNYVYGISQAILGRLIEVLSGNTFFGFLYDNIFEPLEMYNTKFYLTDNDRLIFQPLFLKNWDGTKLFSKKNDELKYNKNSRMHFGSEGLVSTMNDYSNFCEMLVNNGVFKGKKIIDPKSIEMMKNPYTKKRIEYGFYSGFDYGYSFFNLQNPILDGTNSSKGIFGWSGYHNTHFWIDPKKKLYCLFMTRTTPFSSDIQRSLRSSIYSKIN